LASEQNYGPNVLQRDCESQLRNESGPAECVLNRQISDTRQPEPNDECDDRDADERNYSERDWPKGYLREKREW
jgi:hypothetical protein